MSRLQVFFKIGILKNPAIFTGKHSFYKVAGLKACYLTTKRLKYTCFSVNVTKFLGTAFFVEHDCRLIVPCYVCMNV